MLLSKGIEVRKRSHQQFVADWKQTMEEACRIARDNISKSSLYNKGYYDKRAKATVIKPGDWVLCKNVRQRGGTQKLNSYWEEAIFEVIEQKGDLPVFKIRNKNKESDVRTMHRNLLMKCDSLPPDMFKKTVVAKAKEKRKQNEQTAPMEESIPIMSDDETDVMVVIEDEYQEQTQLPNEEHDEDEDGLSVSDEPQEAEQEVLTEWPLSESEEDVTFIGFEDDNENTDSDSSGHSRVPARRSARVPKRRKVLMYDTVGGDPSLVEV